MLSEPGKGSTFTARIPLHVSPDARPHALIAGEKKILVIDDDPAACELLQRSLSRHGFQVVCANSGSLGLSMARELRPALIILDVVIPDMDGWSILTALKLDVETETIPVVMLTMQEQAQVGLSLGAVDYFVKPVEPKKLLVSIGRHLPNAESKLSVLVVEDDAPTRELIERTLAGAGHSVATAENGREGLELLNELPRLSLVVLDLMMPEMDGFEFLLHLRNHDAYRSLPVVVATAKALTEEERELLRKSTQRVIQKSAYSRGDLLRVVEENVTRILSMPPPPNLDSSGELE